MWVCGTMMGWDLLGLLGVQKRLYLLGGNLHGVAKGSIPI
jgi:hypothetical protein